MLAVAAAALSAPAFAGSLNGTFIQLNRAAINRSTNEWTVMLDRMQSIGIANLIVQWSAEPPALYFKTTELAGFAEQYDTLERIMAATDGRHFSIFLGLQNDPSFWNEITARDKVLRDYFLERRAQNERLQPALLKAFGQRADWVGYYIPDEIDDLNWRDPARRQLLKDYLRQTIQSLRQRDPKRAIAISAFLRGRSAPTLVASDLSELTGAIGLDYLLIQDGAGAADPPAAVLPIYYRALLACRSWRAPELWAVLEAFRQTSGNDKPFAAKPAAPDDFSRQIRAAAGFKCRFLFSFPDYVDPERGAAERALYQSLGGPSDTPVEPESMP